MKLKKPIIATALAVFALAGSFNANANPLVLQWSANLSVIPGTESHLPAGVVNGDMIMGSIGWDPDVPHLLSHSNEGSSPQVANYGSDYWTLDFGGGHFFSRSFTDGLGPLGRGNIQIRNDDDTIADGLTLNDAFNFGMSYSPFGPPVNEYIYALRLIDDDRTLFEDFVYNGIFLEPNLPDALSLSVFEHTILSIFKIVYDDMDQRYIALQIGEAGSLKSFAVSEVPIPAAAWLFASALVCFAGYARRRRLG